MESAQSVRRAIKDRASLSDPLCVRKRLARFASTRIHPTSQVESGLFQVLREIEETASLSHAELDAIADLRAWFNEHLEAPDRFHRSRRTNRQPKAISWFKATATHHISRMRALAAILENHGYAVRQLETDRPGYVVYEDEFQVAAVPFADTDLQGSNS